MKKPTKTLVLSIVFITLAFLCIIPIAVIGDDYENIKVTMVIISVFMVLLLVGGSLMVLYSVKINKYKKMEEARQWEALSDEEKEAIEAQHLKEKTDRENARTILKTKLIGQDTTKDASSSLARGVIGGAVFGVAGAVVGAMSGKNKQNCTFYITYKDGHTETKTVDVNSTEFKTYMIYLEN